MCALVTGVHTFALPICLSELPMFGICMGHQILAIALGGKTYKMKYGHRGGNHGVYDKNTKRSYITSKNHGYAVQYESIILKGMDITHMNQIGRASSRERDSRSGKCTVATG